MKKPDNVCVSGHRHQVIVEKIQALIRDDDLKPGDRLPSERTLAASFRVSRNSVREAIRALIEKGVLVNRRGDGTYMAASRTNILMDELSEAVQHRHRRLKEIFQFRRLLEPEIAACAAEHLKIEDLDFLKLTVFEQERRILAGEDDCEQDRAFHLRLARATGNRVVEEVIHVIEAIVGESRSRPMKNPGRQRASVGAHIRIIDALERGDAAAARQMMLNHLTEIERVVLALKNE